MTFVRWSATVLVVLALLLLGAGWQRGNYPLAFVAVMALGILASWARGYADATT